MLSNVLEKTLTLKLPQSDWSNHISIARQTRVTQARRLTNQPCHQETMWILDKPANLIFHRLLLTCLFLSTISAAHCNYDMFRVRGRSCLLLQCRFWTSSILSIADWSNMNVILRGHEQTDQNHLCCRTNTRVIFKDKASNEPQKTKHSSLFRPHKINSITCFSKSPQKTRQRLPAAKKWGSQVA